MILTRWLTWMTVIAIILTFCAIGIGAFTRLSNAGLGCPDWPACYGNIIVKHQPQVENFDMYKAQIEMGHRYIAGALGILLVIIAFLSAFISSEKGRQFLGYGLGLILLLGYQILLGMWTVTLKLSPWIVMQHLLAGVAILALLRVIYLSLREKKFFSIENSVNKKIYFFAWISFFILVVQIILGGWTSSNYAGLVYQGISAIHRWSAVIVSFSIIALFFLIKMRWKYLLLSLLILQVLLGGLNVAFHLPIVIAVGHNLVAATMVLTMVTILFNLQVLKKVKS